MSFCVPASDDASVRVLCYISLEEKVEVFDRRQGKDVFMIFPLSHAQQGRPVMNICSVSACPWEATENGFCSRHSVMALPKKPVSEPKPARTSQRSSDRVCSVEGCEKKIVARKLCNLHYYRLLRTGTTGLRPRNSSPCSLPECERQVYARGVCQPHYTKVKKKESSSSPVLSEIASLVDLSSPPTTCVIYSCASPHFSSGLCRTHLHRAKDGESLADLMTN